MNERVFRVLEYQKVLNVLGDQAQTKLGKDLVLSLAPSLDYQEIVHMQEETDEAAQISRLNKVIPLGGIFDIRASVKRSIIGGSLNIHELLDIASTIYAGRQIKLFFENLEEDLPILKEMADLITPVHEVETEIRNCMDEHGYVMDSASAKLRSIRTTIRTNEGRIREKLNEYTKSKSNMLSDAIITIRNERYVLPVKQEYKAAVGGIVHDQSASGQTLFMEPKAVVELNNRLQEAALQEKQEIDRILQKLTEYVAEHASALLANVDILTKIDFIHARGKLAQKMKAAKPTMNAQGLIKMQQARHPLISAEAVVANDVEIGDRYTSIVITGPNTGGKTVTIKMIGLCVLMAQSGLQVPALDGCELGVFKNVFADIGDEQSIEQNLSTFSSHMTNIVQILEEVDDKSLVLFDELGAGTDPQEGAALAMAILDETISRGARVIATTHYPELKAYGYNRQNVINASMEFNVDTLQPTYRLLIGIPGRSNAFEISQRLGLSQQIIKHAKKLVGTDSKSVENMIAALEKAQIGAQQEYEQAEQVLQDSERLQQDLKREWQDFKDKREKLYRKAEEKAGKALEKAKDEAEKIVSDIRNMKTEAELKEHKWIEARKSLEAAMPELTSKKPDKKIVNKQEKNFHPGDDVKLLSLDQQGTIVDKVNDSTYLVQVGIMKMKVKSKDMQVVKTKKQDYEKPLATVKGSSYHVSPELDLRGERYEDALLKLERYLDDAMLAGYQKVSVIHGKGTGALRKGVENYLKGNGSIAGFRFGTMGEGGSGVTIVELK
ncbi:endonuclease MutS2 [Virgibacillus halophilus]|uniref:endonuclease MutS2 n=1 Tax=Tigheibacillus halophilus TaxID=361280 RepID=UPI0036283FDB